MIDNLIEPCPKCGGYGQTEEIVGEVSVEMASDAGDRTLAGQPMYGNVRCDFCLGSGFIENEPIRKEENATTK